MKGRHVNFAQYPFGRHVNFAQGPLRSYFDEQQGGHVKFTQDPLRSCFDEKQKNAIHLLYFVFTSFVFIICEVLCKSGKTSDEEKL